VFRFLCICVIFSPLVTLVVLSMACCLQHGKKTVRQHFVRVGLMVNSSHQRTKRRPGKVVEATMVHVIYLYIFNHIHFIFFLYVYIYKYTYTYIYMIYAWLFTVNDLHPNTMGCWSTNYSSNLFLHGKYMKMPVKIPFPAGTCCFISTNNGPLTHGNT